MWLFTDSWTTRMSGDKSSATKRPREFRLDSRESMYHRRRNTEACPVSSDTILSVRLVFCGLGDTIVSAPTTLPRAFTSRNYGDCLDFSALPAFSRTPREAQRRRERRRRRSKTETRVREHDGKDSFHINNGGSSITSGGGNGRYAETEKDAR